MSPYIAIIGVAIGAVAANYIYQALYTRDYVTATERSFHQLVALGCVALLILVFS